MLFLYFFISALPEVTIHDLSDDWEFIVLACDGIWDVLSNQVRNNGKIQFNSN